MTKQSFITVLHIQISANDSYCEQQHDMKYDH